MTSRWKPTKWVDVAFGAAQRLHHHLVPELGAVLAIVTQQHAAGLTLRDGGAQLIAPFLIPIPGLQPSQILTEQLRGAESAHPLEGAVDVDDRLMLGGRFAHDDAFGRGIQHPAQKFG